MNEKEFKELVAQVGEQAALKIKAEMDALEKKHLDKIAALEEKSENNEKALREIGKEVSELKSLKKEPVDMSLQGQVKSWMEANKENIAKIKSGQAAPLEPLMIKAPVTMMQTVNAVAPVPLYSHINAPIIDFVRPAHNFWNQLPKGATGLPAYPWIDKSNKQGNAAFIGEGVLKPLASFDLVPNVSNAKKVAERMKASTELLEDVLGMTSLIEQELRFEVEAAANTAVLTGVASSTSPAGITTVASAYTTVGLKTPNPTNLDAIRAAIAQIRNVGYTGTLSVWLNPIDAAEMDMEKALTSGIYLLPPFVSAENTSIKGATVYEDSAIPAGHFLVGDISKYRVLMYKDFMVAWGWENDDFSKNLVTVIGEMRFHQWVSSNNLTAFVYDTFANVKTALT